MYTRIAFLFISYSHLFFKEGIFGIPSSKAVLPAKKLSANAFAQMTFPHETVINEKALFFAFLAQSNTIIIHNYIKAAPKPHTYLKDDKIVLADKKESTPVALSSAEFHYCKK